VSSRDGALDLIALRELAFFTLSGAQLAASDSTFLPCSFATDESEPQPARWVEVLGAIGSIAMVVYLVLSDG
jgi:hypothetical protein